MKCFLTIFFLIISSCMTNQSIIDSTEISDVKLLLNFDRAGSTSSLRTSYSNFLTNGGVKVSFEPREVKLLIEIINHLKGKRHRQKKIANILYTFEIVNYNTKKACYVLTNSKLINLTNSVEYNISNEEFEKMKNLFFLVH